MMRITGFLIVFLISMYACKSGYYIVSDRTPEAGFTENCEGPNVDKEGNLYVVNWGKDGTIARIPPGKPAELFVQLPPGSTANSIQFDKNGDLLLADFTAHQVLRVDARTHAIQTWCKDLRFNQPNDLTISPEGILYASDPNWQNSTGNLWKIGRDHKALLLEDSMGATNGITLSPDGRQLFVNESIQRNIWVYDVIPNGNVENKKLFYHFKEGGLDGMKCDAKGNVYIARWGLGQIAVLSPKGKLLRKIKTKGLKVSNLCFGGPDGKTVYVTLQDRKCIETFQNPVPGANWFRRSQ
ncbi:MAG: SMP-30/gluconolactonase/LRE family protein [Bacteroidetes bacterium]|nr:SMP-30/gluconolactonase/LRE family protein [Bacteroidota bacterium]